MDTLQLFEQTLPRRNAVDGVDAQAAATKPPGMWEGFARPHRRAEGGCPFCQAAIEGHGSAGAEGQDAATWTGWIWRTGTPR
jgi:hypothetical protein